MGLTMQTEILRRLTVFVVVAAAFCVLDGGPAYGQQPQTAQEFFDRGNKAYEKRDYDAAIADYTEAIKLKPGAWGAFGNRGRSYLERKNNQAALADFNEAIRIKPDYADAFYNRSLVYLNQKEFEKTLADCKQAILLRPEHADSHIVCGMALQSTKAVDAAIREFLIAF